MNVMAAIQESLTESVISSLKKPLTDCQQVKNFVWKLKSEHPELFQAGHIPWDSGAIQHIMSLYPDENKRLIKNSVRKICSCSSRYLCSFLTEKKRYDLVSKTKTNSVTISDVLQKIDVCIRRQIRYKADHFENRLGSELFEKLKIALTSEEELNLFVIDLCQKKYSK